MRAKPEMKPWVHTEEKDDELLLERHSHRALGLCRCGSWTCIRWESAAPTGLKKEWKQLTQGLRSGLCRSLALAELFDISPNQFLCYFDAVTLPESGERGSISTATLSLN